MQIIRNLRNKNKDARTSSNPFRASRGLQIRHASNNELQKIGLEREGKKVYGYVKDDQLVSADTSGATRVALKTGSSRHGFEQVGYDNAGDKGKMRKTMNILTTTQTLTATLNHNKDYKDDYSMDHVPDLLTQDNKGTNRRTSQKALNILRGAGFVGIVGSLTPLVELAFAKTDKVGYGRSSVREQAKHHQYDIQNALYDHMDKIDERLETGSTASNPSRDMIETDRKPNSNQYTTPAWMTATHNSTTPPQNKTPTSPVQQSKASFPEKI